MGIFSYTLSILSHAVFFCKMAQEFYLNSDGWSIIWSHFSVAAAAGPGASESGISEQGDWFEATREVGAHRTQDHIEQSVIWRGNSQSRLKMIKIYVIYFLVFYCYFSLRRFQSWLGGCRDWKIKNAAPIPGQCWWGGRCTWSVRLRRKWAALTSWLTHSCAPCCGRDGRRGFCHLHLCMLSCPQIAEIQCI